jgi:hypothetical protein
MAREARIEVEQEGAGRAAHHLHGMAAVIEQPRPFWEKLQDQIAGLERVWFATDGRGTWPPLADATRERKAQQGLDPHIMVATGALRDSLTAGHIGKSRRKSKTVMHFGTSVYYANMQTRRVLVPTDRKFRKMVSKQLAAYIVAPTKKSVPDS